MDRAFEQDLRMRQVGSLFDSAIEIHHSNSLFQHHIRTPGTESRMTSQTQVAALNGLAWRQAAVRGLDGKARPVHKSSIGGQSFMNWTILCDLNGQILLRGQSRHGFVTQLC